MHQSLNYILLFLLVLSSSSVLSQDLSAYSYSELDSFATLYYQEADYKKGLPFMLEALNRSKETSGETDSLHGAYLRTVAIFYDLMQAWDQAEVYYLKGLELQAKRVGKDHPAYALGLDGLGNLYWQEGKLDKAASLFKQSIGIKQKRLGDTSDVYLKALLNLADCYAYFKQDVLANDYYTQYSTKTKKAHGENSKAYSSALTSLIEYYDKAGTSEKSESLHLEIIQIEAQRVGKEHEDYATELNNLAVFYLNSGRYEEARPFLEAAEQIWKKTLGEAHPSYITCLTNMIFLLEHINQVDKATLYYLKIKTIQEQNLGKQHENYMQALLSLAAHHAVLKQYEKTELLYLEWLTWRKEQAGAKSSDYIENLHQIGKWYKDIAAYKKAEKIYLEALLILEDVFGKQAENYLKGLGLLGEMHLANKAYDKATEIYEEQLNILDTWVDNDATKLERILTLNNLGAIAYRAEKLSESEAYIKRAMEIKLDSSNNENIDLVANLAEIYKESDTPEKIEALYLSNLERLKVEAPNSTIYRTEVMRIANFYQEQGNLEKALSYYQESLNQPSKDSSQLFFKGQVLAKIGALHNQNGNYLIAEKKLIESQQIFQKQDKDQTEEYAILMGNLGNLYKKKQQDRKAMDAFAVALDIVKKTDGGKGKEYLHLLLTLGNYATTIGDYTKSEKLLNEAQVFYKKTNQTKKLAYVELLNDLARLFTEKNEITKAIQFAEVALEILNEKSATKSKLYAQTLNSLGKAYLSLSKSKIARSYFEKSKEVYAQLYGKEDLDYILVLNNLAFSYSKGSQFSKAENVYSEALRLTEKVLGETNETHALISTNLGNLYNTMGRYKEAKSFLEKALIFRKKFYGKKHPSYSNSINNLAVLYNNVGQYKEAEALYLEDFELTKELYGEVHNLHAYAMNNLAQFYLAMGQHELALNLFTKTLEVDEKLHGKKHSSYARTQLNLAQLHTQMGRFELAEELIHQALAFWEGKTNERDINYLSALNNLAIFYARTGRFDEAETLGLKVLDLKKAVYGENSPDYALALNNLASMYVDVNKYEEAEPLFLRTKELLEVTVGTTNTNYATALNNLGVLYQNLKQFSKAEDYLVEQQRITAAVLGRNHKAFAGSLCNLADQYKYEKRYDLAQKMLEEAAVIYATIYGKEHFYYAYVLAQLGDLYEKKEVFDQAELLFKESAAITQQIYGNESHKYADKLFNLARLYRKKGTYDQAYQYAWASIAANSKNFDQVFPDLFNKTLAGRNAFAPENCCEEVDDSLLLNLTHLNFKSVSSIRGALSELIKTTKHQYEQLKQEHANPKKIESKLKEHYNSIKAALEINERTRYEFTGKQNQLRILERNAVFVEKGIEAVLEFGNSATYLKEAFSFAEQNKSILLADALKGNRARALGDLPDSLALLEIQLEQQKELLKKRKFQAKTKLERADLLKEENALNRQLDIFVKSLKDKYPKYHALKYQNITAKAKTIQDLLAAKVALEEKALFLEYFVADSSVYLFVLSENKIELFDLKINAATLNKQVKSLRYALSNYKFLIEKSEKAYKKYVEGASWCYESLLKVGLKDKKERKLIIVSDGALGHLPFEAFLTERPKNQVANYSNLPYLMKEYSVSYNYSATLFVNALEKRNKETQALNNGEMLACAADYQQPDSTLLSLRKSTDFEMRMLLQPLPAAQSEVKMLAQNFAGDFLYKASANESFFKEHAGDYSIIHLAMHGILNARMPMLSSLAFSEDNALEEDNFLQAYEISRMQMKADLVVLSACETGYGKFEQGEGVLSLARSFMYAGVPSLVVSLWQVNDQSTAMIMNDFYKNMQKGIAKDVALQQAKLAYLQQANGILAHPAFWSPFIQLGDSEPIVLKGKSSSWWKYTAGVLIFLFILVVLIKRRNDPL